MAVEARRLDRAEMLVLAAGGGAIAAVDLGTGALVRMHGELLCSPLDVLSAEVHPPLEPDPATPDAVEVHGCAEVVSQIRGRRAERYIRPLLHPVSEPLLGSQGHAIPYWTLDGGRPSVAVVEPPGEFEVVRHGRRVHCFFPWRGAVHDLPVVDVRVAASMHRHGQQALKLRRRFVLALTGPYDGHCYKVIIGILPRT